MLTFEIVESNENVVHRARVPGGWLVVIGNKESNGGNGYARPEIQSPGSLFPTPMPNLPSYRLHLNKAAFFYPDPDHNWTL